MDKKIIVPITLFSLNSPIFLSEGSKGNNTTILFGLSSIEELPSKIVELAKEKGIKDIVLYGNESYLTSIKETILTYSASEYSNNKLNIIIEKGE